MIYFLFRPALSSGFPASTGLTFPSRLWRGRALRGCVSRLLFRDESRRSTLCGFQELWIEFTLKSIFLQGWSLSLTLRSVLLRLEGWHCFQHRRLYSRSLQPWRWFDLLLVSRLGLSSKELLGCRIGLLKELGMVKGLMMIRLGQDCLRLCKLTQGCVWRST